MSRAICVGLVCTLAVRAGAEPRIDPTTGRAVFTGAATPSAVSLELNPAALELAAADQELYLGGSAVIDQYSIRTRTNDPTTGALVGGPTVAASALGPGGLFSYFKHLKDVGTGSVMLKTIPIDMFPSGQDALRYHTLGTRERTYSATVGGSVRITDELSFGLSLSAEARHLHLRYARDVALEQGHGAGGVDSNCGGTPCGIGNPLATEIYDVQVHSDLFSTDAITPNVGLVYQLGKDLYAGISYHAPPGLAIQNSLHGNMVVTRAPRDGGNLVHGGATVNLSEPASADLEVRARLPDRLDLHVGMRWADLSRFNAYDVRGYGTALATIGAPEWTERPRGYHDPIAMWAGVEQIETKELWQWRFGGRLGFETSAVPDARTSPNVIAPLSLAGDIGGEVRVPGTQMILQLSYGLQYFPTVRVLNSSYDPLDRLACIDNGFDYSTPACESVRRGYAIATAAGDYSRLEHALRIGLRVQLF
jgi:long-subunit fatty acid transport protein